MPITWEGLLRLLHPSRDDLAELLCKHSARGRGGLLLYDLNEALGLKSDKKKAQAVRALMAQEAARTFDWGALSKSMAKKPWAGVHFAKETVETLEELGRGQDVELLRLLGDSGFPLSSYRCRNGDTLLHKACAATEAGSLAAVGLLLDAHADVTCQSGTAKNTPLHLAVDAKRSEVVEMLLKSESGVRALAVKNAGGQTPKDVLGKLGKSTKGVAAEQAKAVRELLEEELLPIRTFPKQGR